MATIAKITNGASAASALNYALGKGKAMHHDTERWLEEQQLVRPDGLKDCRAIAVGGTNGIDPTIAKEQFKAVQQAFNQNKRRNQVLRITQSFAENELNARNPSDWQRANDLGCELAEKLYPQYQSAVYTHIDGEHHILHNHIIVSKVNLETGKKLDERKGANVERARTANDAIAKKQGWKVIAPVREHQSKTEQDLAKKGQYSYMHDLRSRIDTVMQDTDISDFKAFSTCLSQSGVNVSIRGQNVSYAFLDVNNKQRRARGKRLGTDYDKEAIENELERRARDRKDQQLDREDQRRASELVRDTAEPNRQVEQRKRDTESREPATKQSGQSIDRLTIATGQTEQATRNLGTDYNRQYNRKRRLRDRVTSFANYVRGFTDGLHQFAEQAKQLIADKHLYQDVASRFKADMARKEQNRQAVIKQDLAKRTAPKLQKQQPNQTYNHNRGGLKR